MLGENLLVSTILAEGLDDVRFVEASREKRGETRSELLIELEAEHAVARLVLSHANPEEPLR